MVEVKHPAKLRSLISQLRAPLILISFMVLGFFFRLEMASFFPHQPLFDEKAYIEFAQGMIRQVFVADYYARTYGYPLLLSLIFRIFGHSNLYAIIIIQSILDTLTAGLLLLISLKIWRKNTLAWATFFLYLFNPLTASYCGLYLSEIWGIFLLVLTFYLFVRACSESSGNMSSRARNERGDPVRITGLLLRQPADRNDSKLRLIWYFFCGLALGLFTFTRIMFWWWSILIIIGLFWHSCLRRQARGIASSPDVYRGPRNDIFRIKLLLLIVGFLLTVIYPVMANWQIHKTISPLPVLPVALLDFTNSFKVGRYPAILEDMYREIPLDLRDEYWKIVLASENNRQVYNFYLKPKLREAGRYIISHPFAFFFSRLRNIYYYWDKTNLYYYRDPFYPEDKQFLEVGNAIFLFLALLGIIHEIAASSRRRSGLLAMTLIFTLSLLFYLTIPISLLIPEERHVLPVYPVLCLFLPFGIVLIAKTLSFKKVSGRV